MTDNPADVGVHIGRLFGLLFMMMGPIAVMPTFAAVTQGADAALRGRIAARAAGYAAAAVVLAVLLGFGVLTAWGASKASLIMAAGLLLLLAALGHVVAKPAAASAEAPARSHGPPPLQVALSPLAFPTIVTPHAVGVLIIFSAYFPSARNQALILAAGLGIVLLDYFAMRMAPRFVDWAGPVPLRILGAVFGVLQVALGLEFLLSGLRLARILD